MDQIWQPLMNVSYRWRESLTLVLLAFGIQGITINGAQRPQRIEESSHVGYCCY